VGHPSPDAQADHPDPVHEGPYTSIGDNTQITNSNIEYCITLENSTINEIEKLEESLIGKNAKVT
jgi:glucose-1-phosphate thymidylyltransferase